MSNPVNPIPAPSGAQGSCWFVESVINGTFEGWWAQPQKGIGGWLTLNPHEAKRYTKEQADSVAAALSYFPTPFRWSNWVPTEHYFLDAPGAQGQKGNNETQL